MQKINYTRIEDEEYYEAFGIKKEGSKFIVQDTKKVEAAYQKAWENRNYEIDKFWSRALYFWGFIAATFVAYTAIITKGNAEEQIAKITNISFEICILALGVIFSTAWILVIKGSKRWQENWEKHIDYLENFVSGSLYKTIFYKGEQYYSVSKMSEYVAWAVLGGWVILFFQTFFKFIFLALNLCAENMMIANWCVAVIVFVGVIEITTIFIIFMWKRGKSNQHFIEGKESKPSFYIRKRREDLSDTEVEKEKNIEIEKKGKVEIKVELEEKKAEDVDNDLL